LTSFHHSLTNLLSINLPLLPLMLSDGLLPILSHLDNQTLSKLSYHYRPENIPKSYTSLGKPRKICHVQCKPSLFRLSIVYRPTLIPA
jgi:hypothetical protein